MGKLRYTLCARMQIVYMHTECARAYMLDGQWINISRVLTDHSIFTDPPLFCFRTDDQHDVSNTVGDDFVQR